MECQHCGYKNINGPANFCPKCGQKLNETCEICWVKNKKPYNCGQDKCPGYRLHMLGKRSRP